MCSRNGEPLAWVISGCPSKRIAVIEMLMRTFLNISAVLLHRFRSLSSFLYISLRCPYYSWAGFNHTIGPFHRKPEEKANSLRGCPGRGFYSCYLLPFPSHVQVFDQLFLNAKSHKLWKRKIMHPLWGWLHYFTRFLRAYVLYETDVFPVPNTLNNLVRNRCSIFVFLTNEEHPI